MVELVDDEVDEVLDDVEVWVLLVIDELDETDYWMILVGLDAITDEVDEGEVITLEPEVLDDVDDELDDLLGQGGVMVHTIDEVDEVEVYEVAVLVIILDEFDVSE